MRKPVLFAVITAILFINLQVYAQSPVHLRKIGVYTTGIFDKGAAEISAYDKASKKLFVVNGKTGDIDVVSISNPASPFLADTINITPWGSGANSVAVKDGIVAAAVQNNDKTLNGFVVFFRTNGQYIKHVTVGALPDMITFTPDGKNIVVANEGEPNDSYTVDPLGTVSIIEYPSIQGVKQSKVHTLNFNAFNSMVVHPSIKINGPGATIAQDLEPEYVTVSKNSRYAYVTLQENNALAKIDIKHKQILSVIPLGVQDHNQVGFGMDASDKNSGIVDIKSWPVKGLYQPDAIASFKTQAGEFLVMANEGDVRDYPGFSEAKRIKDTTLDLTAFPNAATLKNENNLGRLNITKSMGDIGNDGDYDELYSFGSRSVSIRTSSGNLVWDSGDFLEQITYQQYPAFFNASSTSNTKKSRSDDKGPEPEGLAVAEIMDSVYLFLALERIGGVVVFNVTDPYNPRFIEYVNTRDFTQVPSSNSGGDLGPEGMLFISCEDSPNNKSLLVVSNEVSGSVTIFETDYICNCNSFANNDDDDDDDDDDDNNRFSKVTVCYNGLAQCVPVFMLDMYLQNGAVLGNCSGLRIAGNTTDLTQNFKWDAMYNSGKGAFEISWENSLENQFDALIFDVSGRIIYRQQLFADNNTETISISDIPAGVYFVKLSGNNIDETKKVVVH